VGGSYAIEGLTDQMEEEVTQYLEKIDSAGGMLAAIESGWVQGQIHEAAYKYQQSIENKERIIVGVNEFRIDEEQKIVIHLGDPAIEAAQIESLSNVRLTRDSNAVRLALERLDKAARQGSENLMPHILEAVEAYATVGEISDAFRRVHGEYREVWTV
jgi:methylmalonyl-CoA mutase, N-terminal domain